MKHEYIKYSAGLSNKLGFGSARHLQLNCRVLKANLHNFEVMLKMASQKMKKKELIQINVIFVDGI